MLCFFLVIDVDIIQFLVVYGDNKFNICIIFVVDYSERKIVLGGKVSVCRGIKRSFLIVFSMV